MLGSTVLAVLAMASTGSCASYLAFMPRCWKACSREAGLMCNWGDVNCLCQAASRGVLANANSCACNNCGSTDFKTRLGSDLPAIANSCRRMGAPISQDILRAVSEGAECAPQSPPLQAAEQLAAPAPPPPPAAAPAPPPPAPMAPVPVPVASPPKNDAPLPKPVGPQDKSSPTTGSPAAVPADAPKVDGPNEPVSRFSWRQRVAASVASLFKPSPLGQASVANTEESAAVASEQRDESGEAVPVNEQSAAQPAPVREPPAPEAVAVANPDPSVSLTIDKVGAPTPVSIAPEDFNLASVVGPMTPLPEPPTVTLDTANATATTATEALPPGPVVGGSPTLANSTLPKPKPQVNDSNNESPEQPGIVSVVQTIIVSPVPVAQIAKATAKPEQTPVPGAGAKPDAKGANGNKPTPTGPKNGTQPATFAGTAAKLEVMRPLTAMGLIVGLAFGFA